MKAASGKPALLRDINRKRVLRALRDADPDSRAGLARRLGISKVTVSTVVQDLIAEGFAREVGTSRQGSGRRATLLDLDRRAGVVVAADVAAEQVRLLLASLHGRPLAERAFATPGGLKPLLARFSQAFAALTGEAGVSPEAVAQLCVAVPASVGPNNKVYFSGAPGYLAELPRLAAALPGTPLRFVNDMNMAAVGEQHGGVAKNWVQFAFLGVRKSGVGMGLVLSGRVYAGIHGRAGEVGLLRLEGQPTALDMLAEHDSEAVLAELSRVLATTVALLDLEGIVFYTDFAGGVDWLGRLGHDLEARVPYPVELLPSSLGRDAPLKGALVIALEQAWRRLEARADILGGAEAV
jgi:predicted NBD/HSP70 family sugar kinase/biotin operon repressor